MPATGVQADAIASSAKTWSAAQMNQSPLPHVKPPAPLNRADCSPKKWKLWKQTWINYAVVAKITSQDAQYQKALFLCTIGQGALEIFNTFRYNTGEDPEKVDTIIAKFDEYFTGEVNETYERFKFNQRNQVGESFDAYLIALRNMAETCNFCTCPRMTDSRLRDRIVLGIKNGNARKWLLRERKLDLKCL